MMLHGINYDIVWHISCVWHTLQSDMAYIIMTYGMHYDAAWHILWYDISYGIWCDEVWQMLLFSVAYIMMLYNIYHDAAWHTLWCCMAYIMMSYDIYYDEVWYILWCHMAYIVIFIALYGIYYDVLWHKLWSSVTYGFVCFMIQIPLYFSEYSSLLCPWGLVNCAVEFSFELLPHVYTTLRSFLFMVAAFTSVLQHSPTHIVHN